MLVIDAQGVGGGQTGVTTAHLSNEIDDTYVEIVRLHGPDNARLACDSHRAAIDAIEAICTQESIDCRSSGWTATCSWRPGHREPLLDRELEAARLAGVDVMRLPDAAATGFTAVPACGSRGRRSSTRFDTSRASPERSNAAADGSIQARPPRRPGG